MASGMADMGLTLLPKACKCIWYGACVLTLAASITQAGFYYREGKAVEAHGLVIAASFESIEAMHKSIPWEDRVKRQNDLLLAVCKKQKTKLCKDILDDFARRQQVAGR